MNRLVAVVVAVVLLIVVSAWVAFRMNPKTSPKQSEGEAGHRSNPQGEVSFEAVRDALRKGEDFGSCRNAIQQLNNYLSKHPDEKPPTLTPEEKTLLTGPFGLDDEELAEVAPNSFTLLDAHHLEFCFLLRDAVRSLRLDTLPPLERASAGFAWVMRQVRLRERTGDALPPHFVLRRGWGTALERGLVFLALLDQLGVDGCMLLVPAGAAGQTHLRYWIPGALVDKQIYLFDTRLGLPVPGPNGQGVATLARVRTQPELLQALTVDEKFPYDVTADQAKQAEIHVACYLSALAPRMRYLQDVLASSEKVILGTDPAARWQRFQVAAKDPALAGVLLKFWGQAGDFNTPLRVLRLFLPPEEGGVDKTRRREQWLQQLVPWDLLPRSLVEMPPSIGQRLQALFSVWFLNFYMEPRMPRDLVLRGRFDDATSKLVTIPLDSKAGALGRDEWRRLRDQVRANPKLEEDVNRWRLKAFEIAAALQKAQEAAANPQTRGPEAQIALAEANKRLDEFWKTSQPLQLLVLGAAAEPMARDTTYLLALCKHELAERAQISRDLATRGGKTASESEAKALRVAWTGAAGWWVNFLNEYDSAPSAPTARLLLARARQALGEREAAIGLLENLSGELTTLEKTGRLYLAKQLKAR
jgi:hypothetical protein